MEGASESRLASERESGVGEDFVISLKHMDREQGQTFIEWEQDGILAQALDALQGYCCRPLSEQSNSKKFTIYGAFPPSDKTDFQHPKHVPEDAEWARIHLTGERCIIGHVVRNIFYVVFLDKHHRFWISQKKHT